MIPPSSTRRPVAGHAAPRVTRLAGLDGCALTVDVEEWYHNCLVPRYVHPERRPVLPVELDRLLPELLGLLAEAGATATFFVLGEVAERLPGRIREIAAAGHEVASHGHLHLRACERPRAELSRDLRRAKAMLEDLLGEAVLGFRAPEWSLRRFDSELLPLVVEAGFLYDSSLAPYPLSGSRRNPLFASRLEWDADFRGDLLEFPPLTFGGPLRVPAGSWTGRIVPTRWLASAARRHRAAGGLPVAVVHPWEISGQPTPGPLGGAARFIHETGRAGFVPRFREYLAELPWRTLAVGAGLVAARSTAAGLSGEQDEWSDAAAAPLWTAAAGPAGS